MICEIKKNDQYSGISLSVREKNPAVKLYEFFGFNKILESEVKNRTGVFLTMLMLFEEHRKVLCEKIIGEIPSIESGDRPSNLTASNRL